MDSGNRPPAKAPGLDYRLLKAHHIEYRERFTIAEAWFGQDSREAAEMRAARDHILFSPDITWYHSMLHIPVGLLDELDRILENLNNSHVPYASKSNLADHFLHLARIYNSKYGIQPKFLEDIEK